MELYRVILKAKNIRDHYKNQSLSADSPPISIDDYVDVISEYEEIIINRHTLDRLGVDWKSKQIKGCLLRYAGSADIYVAPKKTDTQDEHGITYCEERFITVKEASHLVIDGEDSFIDGCIKLVEEIVYPPSMYIDKLSEAVQSEWMAEIFALELLFPFEVRAGFRNRILDADDKLTAWDVADQFKIPLKKVEWILSDGMYDAIFLTHEKVQSDTSKGP